jgi:hypothetical protein
MPLHCAQKNVMEFPAMKFNLQFIFCAKRKGSMPMATLTEEEEILTFDVSDEALEIAGSDKTNFTWGVCTLDQPGCFPSIFVGDQNTHGIAAECRRLVASVSRPEDKQALETLARAWDRIADERETRLLKQIDGDTLIN